MKAVKITLKNYRCFSDTEPARFILKDGLTSFIGVNNVGKSSILKFFYEFRNVFNVSFLIDAITRSQQGNPFDSKVLDAMEVFCSKNKRDIKIEIEIIEKQAIHAGMARKDIYINKIEINLSRSLLFKVVLFDSENNDISNETVFDRWKHMDDIIQCLNNTFYAGSFRNAINPFNTLDLSNQRNIQSLHTSYYDITVGAQFIQFWKDLKTGNSSVNAEKAIDLTNEICKIFNFDNLDIFTSSDERNLFFVVDGKRYNLLELGSGISQFFLMLANIVVKKPSFILIDEPEINLHPSLQIEFLDILERYASNGVLYATHSVGLARHADRIYSVYKGNNKTSTIREFEKQSRLTELLGELSYSTYRELGFKKVLLVEGRTEIKVVQQFLRKYNKDNEFFVVSLGGSQYICEHSQDELREFMRTSEKIFTVIDSEKEEADKPLEASRQKFIDNCREIGIKCHVLKHRAIENYFPTRVVKAIKGSASEPLQPYEKLKDQWAKSENWRFAQEMTIDELEATDLGQFIKEICEI